MSGQRRSPPGRSAGRWLWDQALELLYPTRCVSCARFGVLLCDRCAARMEPATGEGRCPNCAARWDAANNCPRCFGWVLDGVYAAFEMDGPARNVVHGLKYRGVRALATLMADAVGPVLTAQRVDTVIAVPLHRSRQRERGFNQAELLVNALGAPPPEGRLRRTKNTAHQVGLTHRDRRSNVAGAFSYEGPSLAGQTVALVDDVVTTGATANECARVLRDHGARRVVAVAYARASYEPGSAGPIVD